MLRRGVLCLLTSYRNILTCLSNSLNMVYQKKNWWGLHLWSLKDRKKSQNSTTHVKWNGLITDGVIRERKGNRQGGLASSEEWKVYNNEMIEQLEQCAKEQDIIAGVPTSCVAIADDVAPCATASHPRDAIHQMQLLLNIVEDHGTQLHMKFGADKCKLLISGRPTKIKAVKAILNEEPETLTFYGTPVQIVEDYYVHIGVPQAPHNQSKVVVDYRILKSQEISYQLQGATKKCTMLG